MTDYEKKGVHVTERAMSHGIERHETAEEREAREDKEMRLEAGQDSESSSIRDPDWKPGYASRFPWLGASALLFILVAAIGCVVTLSLADGRSESQWPERIAPNVIVNVLNNVSNLAFGIAISNGIAIAWWRRTLQGSTIEQLNRSWRFSSSIKDVIFQMRYFNVIALAALTAKLTIIDGALLQESFSTETKADAAKTVSLRGYANETIPMTGRVALRSKVPSLLAKNFNDDLKIWVQGGGLFPNLYEGCDGLCFFRLPGAGFEVECTPPQQVTIDYGAQVMNATGVLGSAQCSNTTFSENGTAITTPINATQQAVCDAAIPLTTAKLFDLQFNAVMLADTYAWINMSIVSTSANSTNGTCPATQTVQSCKLRPAVINYPVRIENYNDAHAVRSMQLGVDGTTVDNSTFHAYNITLKQQNTFEILRYNDVNETFLYDSFDTRTRLGGVALGLQTYLGGSAALSYSGANGYAMIPENNAAVYLFNDLGTQAGQRANQDDCGYQFVNPMDQQHFDHSLLKFDPKGEYDVPSLIGKINQIMFALALDVSNEDDDKDVAGGTLNRTAIVYKDAIHYKIDHRYMWGAFACMIFCILCIIPVYWGYWQLGRNVTLGPFEIAAAFRAPNLHHHSNKPIDELIKEVGDRQVKFGAISGGNDAGKIAVAEPDRVSRIHPAATPAGLKRFSIMHTKSSGSRM